MVPHSLKARLHKAVCEGIAELLNALRRRGTSNTDTNNAVKAIIAAALSERIKKEHLGMAFEREFKVRAGHRKKGQQRRRAALKSHVWTAVQRAQYRNAISDEAAQVIFEWCHTNEASIENNDDKRDVRVYPPGQGDSIHRHWIRVQKGDDSELREAFVKSGAFARWKGLTCTPANPLGLECSVSTMRRYKCRCLKHQNKTGLQCVCDTCTERRHNRRSLRSRAVQWLMDVHEPQECECRGDVCGPGGTFLPAIQSDAALDAAVMCPKEHYMDGALDTPHREFHMHSKACHMGTCDRCGIEAVVGERVCERLYSDAPCTIHHFDKVVRGMNRKGEEITATEFVPKFTTRRGTMDDYFGEDGMLRADLRHKLALRIQEQSPCCATIASPRLSCPPSLTPPLTPMLASPHSPTRPFLALIRCPWANRRTLAR